MIFTHGDACTHAMVMVPCGTFASFGMIPSENRNPLFGIMP
jgi:hypothetical protein